MLLMAAAVANAHAFASKIYLLPAVVFRLIITTLRNCIYGKCYMSHTYTCVLSALQDVFKKLFH